MLTDKQKATAVAAAAKRQVREEHSFEHYRATLIGGYDQIKSALNIRS